MNEAGQYEPKHAGPVQVFYRSTDEAYVPKHTVDAGRYTEALREAIRALHGEYAA